MNIECYMSVSFVASMACIIVVLLSAMSSTAGLVMYLTAIELDPDHRFRHGYGAGYGLAWMSDCLFAAASVCMCLDDITNSLCAARRLRRGSHGDRNRHVTAAPSSSHHL